MIELQGPIDIIEGDESLKVYRDGDVFYKDGKPEKINKTSFKIICNVQPINGRELLLVPEGDRYKEIFVLFVKGMPLKQNDRVVRNCKNYQVQNIKPWGSYQEVRIMLDDVGVYSDD